MAGLKRRDFLSACLATGAALPTLGLASVQKVGSKGIAEGGPLEPPKDGSPILVAVPVSVGTTWIDFVGPEAAFSTWHYDTVEKKHKPRFKTVIVAEKPDPVDGLVPDFTFENVPACQIALVPAQQGSAALLDWLRRVSKSADITMSVCIGARHLAKAGLLDGLKATTHHESLAQFEKEYPSVMWVRGARFVEGPKISTGGGLTAGIDLALRVTERYFGRDWAKQVADHIEYQSTGWIVGRK